jgi:hypothetical protein
LIDNSSGCKSSSIQCGQRTHNSENQLSSGKNINNILSTTTTTPELSSESRIQSFSSHDYDGFEKISADDFEVSYLFISVLISVFQTKCRVTTFTF